MIDTSHFTSTEAYHRFGLFPDVATDGAIYVAKKAGAFWLLDAIVAQLRHKSRHEHDTFAVAKLEVDVLASKGVLKLDDGNGNVFATEKIQYTDFPDPDVTFFAKWIGNRWVLMVPSEY